MGFYVNNKKTLNNLIAGLVTEENRIKKEKISGETHSLAFKAISIVCFKCKGVGHITKHCKGAMNRNYNCNNCGKKGHKENECKNPKI